MHLRAKPAESAQRFNGGSGISSLNKEKWANQVLPKENSLTKIRASLLIGGDFAPRTINRILKNLK